MQFYRTFFYRDSQNWSDEFSVESEYNPRMPRIGIVLLGGFGLAFFSACTSTPAPLTPTVTATRVVTLFDTPTPSPVPAISTPAVAATQTPLPSPTPFTYMIAAGDTLLAIAFRFGVTVDELLKVNPGIDPGFLTVGSDLVIPIGEEGSAFLPTPTPVPVGLGDPECHLAADRSVWCFMPVVNENSFGLEGVNGWVDLYNSLGELVATQEAASLLNVIPAGNSLPLVAYFPGRFDEGHFGRGYIRGAFLANNLQGRYLEHSLGVQDILIATDGDQAVVSGEIFVGEGTGADPLKATISVVLIAHASDGRIVGHRRWDWQGDWTPGDGIPFVAAVYSLSGEIERVEVSSEVRPGYQPEAEE